MKRLSFIILLSLFSLTLFAQDYSKLIEKGKYSKVIGKCDKKLLKDPIDMESLYFSALIKCKNESGKYFNPEDAYNFFLKASSLYYDYNDQIKNQNIDKIPINHEILVALGDSIFSAALILAEKVNTEQIYVDYLNKYSKVTDLYKNKAINERNRLAYTTANELNTIESYNLFISKYPNAMQADNAWKNIYDLAYESAKIENTILGYEKYISDYPKSHHLVEAKEQIEILAYAIAVSENTSESFKSFMNKYPNSKQYSKAKELFYKREFEENTTAGVWETYRDFYQNFDGPFKNIALDSLIDFSYNGDYNAFDFIVSNNLINDSLSKMAFNVFVKLFYLGDLEEMEMFYKKYYGYFNYEELKNIVNSVNLVKEGIDLKLTDSYLKNNRIDYINYIKNNGNLDLSYVILQRLISDDIINKKYDLAVKTIESLELYFTRNIEKINNLKSILISKVDKSIVPVPLLQVNSLGNEYSPLISADNNLILYCGKDRVDNNGGEDIFISFKEKDKFTKPFCIKELSQYNSNEAPICLSSDGNELLMFSNGKIYQSLKSKEGWGTPSEVKEINSEFWQGDASLTSDNNTLFFARGGYKIEKEKVEIKKDNVELINVQSGINKNKLVNEYLLGDGITANNIIISPNSLSYGFFSGGLNSGLPIDAGIMLSSGNVNNAASYNYNSETSFENNNNNYNNLQELVPDAPLFDATELTFDFVSISDTMSFNYIFGSEEYPEFVCSEFNDVFGFFLSGPNPNGGYYENENIAKLPNSNTFVSINTINNGNVGENGVAENCDNIDPDWKNLSVFYNNNFNNKYGWELDGFTDVLSTGAKLIPGEKYTISISISDVNDQKYDSYVILEKNSFRGITLISNKNVFKNINGDFLPLSDIYISHRSSDGKWQVPKKLPNSINTSYTERSPFIHPDMKTLYFSSDGHGGLGRLDVFMSKRLADSCWDCWSEPVNLGKEINSPNSDWGYKISTDGQMAYFSKDSKSKTREDIYTINLPPHLRPDFVARVDGKIKGVDNKPISTTIHWEDLESNKVIGTSKTNPIDGSYFIVLPMGKNYGYFIEDSSYFPISQNLDLRTERNAVEVSKDIVGITFKEMIDNSIAVPMNNLFFEFGKYHLLSASKPELIRISKIIKRYNLKIEIAGHTDDVGDEKSNLTLSEKRANAVKEFLINQGCSAGLLQTLGYGESKPIVNNDSDENRAKNRRVELRFIK